MPYRATSNSYAAKCMANFVIRMFGFSKLYLLEIGAGHCIYSHQLARYLQREYPNSQAKVLITDFNENLLRSRMNQPCFADLVPERVDFAVWDLQKPCCTLTSLQTGQCIIHFTSENAPLIIIGNYLADSLPHDIFRVSTTPNRNFEEGTITTCAYNSENGNVDIHNISVSYRPTDVEACYGGDPVLTHSLKATSKYAANVLSSQNASSVSFLFPCTLVRALSRLCNRKAQTLLFIIDKPYYIDDFALSAVPENVNGVIGLDRHGLGGIVSVGVDFGILNAAMPYHKNFKQIRTYAMSQHVVVEAFAFGSDTFSCFASAFQICFDTFGIADYELVTGMLLDNRIRGNVDVVAVLAFLRQSGFDWEIFKAFAWSLSGSILPGVPAVAFQCFKCRSCMDKCQWQEQNLFFSRWCYARNDSDLFLASLPEALDVQTAIMAIKLMPYDADVLKRVKSFAESAPEVTKRTRNGRRLAKLLLFSQ